ncbi:hypothetical protein HDV00_001633 [Rhizophlyctis rosea]|nr:hypothetical protein HDV00_001633 [Rhizophlyctis rosea]
MASKENEEPHPIELKAHNLLSNISPSEALAYIATVSTDFIHGTIATIEELYLPETKLVVNRDGGQINIFKWEEGPRLLIKATLRGDPFPSRNLRIVKGFFGRLEGGKVEYHDDLDVGE